VSTWGCCQGDVAAREMGKHNHVTTTYHLLLEKKKRSGGFLKAAGHGP